MQLGKEGRGRVYVVAALLVGSGLCALIYQVAWLRELRLVFGASTAASAAVLAIFMGGLGAGGALLGRLADRSRVPLGLYATLEILIALVVAASPFLLDLVRRIYIEFGGSIVLGSERATLVRLGLSALVLGLPTFLMGGTLPAAVRAVEGREDTGRSAVAFLYGANTLGAVAGAFISTFVLLEIFGTRTTLWMACLLNGLIALFARALARSLPPFAEGPDRALDAQDDTAATVPAAPPVFVLFAAMSVGFAFFLMELVWYRMLAPLLGGSTYTFGLILAVALLGIGLGGALYAWTDRGRPATLRVFSLSTALEALFIALPYAAGDRLAVLTKVLRDLASMGFYGQVFGWFLIGVLVVLPAAIIAGYQFPLLIALLGRGARHVGKQTGLAYACNTLGAILGALAGGFGVLPLLGALGVWRAVVLLLALLSILSVLIDIGRSRRPSLVIAPLLALALAVLAVTLPLGPTAAWRHGGIGAGRPRVDTTSANALQRSLLDVRRFSRWERDGIESSVAMEVVSGIAFIINGKNDGNARFDASTQVMFGLISALVHPQPKSTFVVGLGTGSSAGWLAAVDGMERVDVAELEPAIVEIARRSKDVNHDALNNPKVHIYLGDAREFLLTIPEKYDLIVSEPSNPYRAGIAGLYTKEFYEAVSARLNPGGIFSQWVQAYEIDAKTFRTIYATLAAVFPYVETWQTNPLDLVMLCSHGPIEYDVPALRERIQQAPFQSALLNAWAVTDVEGLFSRYVANTNFPKRIAQQEKGRLNTDDRTLVEYGFARTVGRSEIFSASELRNTAFRYHDTRPLRLHGDLNWPEVEEQRLHMSTLMEHAVGDVTGLPTDLAHRSRAFAHFIKDELDGAWREWSAQDRQPVYPLEVGLVAEVLAEQGDERALEYAGKLWTWWPLASDAVLARLAARQGRAEEAVHLLERALIGLRTDPWPLYFLMERAMKLTQALGEEKPEFAPRLLAALDEPFSTLIFEEYRMELLVGLASRIGPERAAVYIERYEPNVLWTREFLEYRLLSYRAVKHPALALANRQLLQFIRNASPRFADMPKLLPLDGETGAP